MTSETSGDPPWTATNSAGYQAPAALAVDVVVLTVNDRELRVLAVDGGAGPLRLPGGFVGRNEEPRDAAARKLVEKTGLDHIYLEQLATFADPHRDPRGWIPTVGHLALVPGDTAPADPAAAWVSANHPPPLAFDHAHILRTALERVRGKIWWSNVAVGILPDEFTLTEARTVYEAITGLNYDPSTFGRDLRGTGLISLTGNERGQDRGRPAALHRYVQQEPAWGAGRRKRIQP
jgi:8-oxo-dGTP diphosphatase